MQQGRPWYSQQRGYGEEFAFASVNTTGQVYVDIFDGGVMGIDVVGLKCPIFNLCEVAKTAVPSQIASVMEGYEDETTLGGVQMALRSLLFAPNVTGFTSAMWYVGYDNKNTYLIKDCSWKIAGCESAPGYNSSMRILGFAGNVAVYGNSSRRIYPMDWEGNIGAEIGMTSAYDPTVSFLKLNMHGTKWIHIFVLYFRHDHGIHNLKVMGNLLSKPVLMDLLKPMQLR